MCLKDTENDRRREFQAEYNRANGIIPKSIVRPLEAPLGVPRQEKGEEQGRWATETGIPYLTDMMNHFAANLEFENAARVRDRIAKLKEQEKKIH